MKTVIEMAREARAAQLQSGLWLMGHTELERFAELVRADEYESCAKMVDHILKEGSCKYCNAIRAKGNT